MKTLTDNHGLRTFEYFNGLIREVDWKPAGIFISSSYHGHQTTQTFFFDKREGATYLKALNLKNAVRKFNSKGL